jgi:threonine dehydrogenase-like Zn-dependent dehydrogenase
MTRSAAAMVQVGVRQLEQRRFERREIGPDEAWLKIEANGVCGTDVEVYEGQLAGLLGNRGAFIPGHEPLGHIAEIGDAAARRWGVKVGDRVAVEPFIRCGTCSACVTGHYSRCRGWDGRSRAYGSQSAEVEPGLWGGYAEFLYLHPNTILHPIPAEIPTGIAALWNALGGSVRWAGSRSGTQSGDSVVIFGPGQRGIGCVIAAREAGAARIVVTGLEIDRPRLEVALAMGADAIVVADKEDTVTRIRELVGEADVAIDASAMATQPILDSIEVLRPGGRLMLAGLKGGRAVPGLVTDRIIQKELNVTGAWGVDYLSYREAIRIIKGDKYPLHLMECRPFPLDQAATAIKTLSREVGDGTAVSVMIRP